MLFLGFSTCGPQVARSPSRLVLFATRRRFSAQSSSLPCVGGSPFLKELPDRVKQSKSSPHLAAVLPQLQTVSSSCIVGTSVPHNSPPLLDRFLLDNGRDDPHPKLVLVPSFGSPAVYSHQKDVLALAQQARFRVSVLRSVQFWISAAQDRNLHTRVRRAELRFCGTERIWYNFFRQANVSLRIFLVLVTREVDRWSFCGVQFQGVGCPRGGVTW